MTDFALPQLAAQAAPEFVDAKSAKVWLEHVPLANLGAAQHQMLLQLEEFNRFATSAAVRLEVLETLREAINFVQIEQAKRFTHRALPIAPAEAKVFQDTIDLWGEMRLGYLRCLEAAERKIRVVEELSRGVSLGRDTFSSGVIRSNTVDAAVASLEAFRKVMDTYGAHEVRAVATSAVREARNGEMFLDRIRGRTGITFEIINEAEESRLVYLAVRDEVGRADFFKSASPLLIEVGGGSTSLTRLRLRP